MINKIKVKQILNKHKKRDDWFLDDYSLNPYIGCSFNCVYCYIRGSKYGKNKEKILSVKINAPELLEKELKRRVKKGEYGIILISSSTEAYGPVEKELKLTRKLLEIISKYRFPVHILTKSSLVIRDLDILKEIDNNAILPEDLKSKLDRGVIISFSFSSLDDQIVNIFEPGAPKPSERLETMKKVKKKGFFVGASFVPVLPYISDSEENINEMIKMAKNFRADFVFLGALTLFGKNPDDCRTIYYKVLKKHFPSLLPKYEQLFGKFFTPSRSYLNKLEETGRKLCDKYGIKYKII